MPAYQDLQYDCVESGAVLHLLSEDQVLKSVEMTGSDGKRVTVSAGDLMGALASCGYVCAKAVQEPATVPPRRSAGPRAAGKDDV